MRISILQASFKDKIQNFNWEKVDNLTLTDTSMCFIVTNYRIIALLERRRFVRQDVFRAELKSGQLLPVTRVHAVAAFGRGRGCGRRRRC